MLEHPFWEYADPIWSHLKKNWGNFCFVFTAPIFVGKPYFQPIPGMFTLECGIFVANLSMLYIFEKLILWTFKTIFGVEQLYLIKVSLLGGQTKTKDFWQLSSVSALFHSDTYFSDI